jgi:exopolysaccharide biosynthesis polyprenyl glycosylphosphotransferase
MIKERIHLFRKLMIISDLLIVAAAFFLGYFLRDPFVDPQSLSACLWLLPATVLIWGVLLYTFGVYDSFRTKTSSEFVLLVLRIAFIGFIVLSGLIYLFRDHLRLPPISRSLISAVFVYAAGLVLLEKVALMNFFRFFRKLGLNFRILLVVGTGKRAEHFIDLVKSHAEWGLRIHGLVDEDTNRVGTVIKGSKVLGSFEDFPGIIHNNVIDQVVFIVPRTWMGKIENLVYLCEEEGIKISLALDFFNFRISRAKQTDLFGFPLITFESAPDRLWHLIFKRLFDILVSFAGLLLLWPLFLIIAMIIKFNSPGPVFFRQKRVGLNGRIFTLVKFRTMVKDAEEKLGDLLHRNEMKGPVFKMANDPRLTSVGKFLRRSSLDEFPQLWNVLKGNMSLIGPRPPLPSEVKKYESWQRRRLSMRPGITCLWQANGRNKISDFDEWMRLDLEYIDNWSLWLDLQILFKTIPVVLTGSGAK